MCRIFSSLFCSSLISPLCLLSSSVTLFFAHLTPPPPSLHRFNTHTHTHTITQLSLSLSRMSATEVRVWVFYPRATQPCFTMTVTPALSATLDPALLRSSARRLAMTTAPGHTLRHMLHVQSCAVGPVMVAIPLSGPLSRITKQAGMQRKAELWCGCEVNYTDPDLAGSDVFLVTIGFILGKKAFCLCSSRRKLKGNRRGAVLAGFMSLSM